MSVGPRFFGSVKSDLEGLVQGSIGSPDSVSLLTPVGPAAQELLHAGAAAKAGVIVLGTEGLGRAHRVVFGSTTLRVLRGTDRPVLAVPPRPEGEAGAGAISRILCGVDFSDASRAAAVEAVALGRHLNVPVTLLHAVVRLPLPSIWDVRLVPTNAERALQARGRIQELAASFGAPEPSTVVAIGEPAELMARESTPTTLVALGLGDREGHRPGSTAMRIMADSHVPVLGIPATPRSASRLS
jgi:nucleotide-binding universal stress UspA family protein